MKILFNILRRSPTPVNAVEAFFRRVSSADGRPYGDGPYAERVPGLYPQLLFFSEGMSFFSAQSVGVMLAVTYAASVYLLRVAAPPSVNVLGRDLPRRRTTVAQDEGCAPR